MRLGRSVGIAAVVALMVFASPGCGTLVRQGRSPSQLVIVSLLTAQGTGAMPTAFFGGPLLSSVGNVGAGEAVHGDFAEVTMRVVLRDPGSPGNPTSPSPVNDVTVRQYHVEYRGTPGVTVPRGFDGAVTFTVPAGGTAVGVFELVRRVAKMERPLAALAADRAVLTTIADVTFFGSDQAGNTLSVTGSVQINFANFR